MSVAGHRAKIRVNGVHVLDSRGKAVTHELFADFLSMPISGFGIILDDDDVHGQIAVMHPPAVSLGDGAIRVGGHIERVLILERRRRAGATEALLEERLEVEPFLKSVAAQDG